MEKTQDNVGKLETELKQWRAKLNELIAKANRAGTTARIDNGEPVGNLKPKVQATPSTLDAVKSAGSKKWDTLKTGVESAWNKVELAFKKLRN
jgi:hypothetical protein